MRTRLFALLAVGLLALSAGVTSAFGQDWSLRFIPTQNAPPGASGLMSLKVVNGDTIVHFSARGLHHDTVYTIWTVFNVLKGRDDAPADRFTTPEMIAFYQSLGAAGSHKVPSSSASARPDFPKDGNGVSPTARLDSGFTSGMGLDPGASFVTNDRGDGEIRLKLDFDLVDAAPVSSKDIITQCVPVPGSHTEIRADGKEETVCNDPGSRLMRVTTTYLRRFIGQFKGADWPSTATLRFATCANYDQAFDGDNPLYRTTEAFGMDARFWQCVDPTTGLPLVHRYEFNHFRVANHPDDLTHGFIGGSAEDHWIDMVGRRADRTSASTGTGR